MTTVVNNPAPVQSSDSGIGGVLIGAIVLFGIVMIIAYFGIPLLRSKEPMNVIVPSPQIVIPEKIDVNINQAK